MKIQPANIRDSDAQKESLKQVSKQYEALFVNQLVSAMRKTVDRTGSLVPESHAEKTYQNLLDYEHSQRIADSELLGLSKLVYEHLLRGSGAR